MVSPTSSSKSLVLMDEERNCQANSTNNKRKRLSDYENDVNVAANALLKLASSISAKNTCLDPNLAKTKRARIDSKITQTNHNNAIAWCNKGAAHNEKQEWDQAIKACKKAIELDPEDAVAWNNKGAAHNGKQEWDQAIKACKKALELDPECAVAWNNKGAAHNGKQEWNQAIKACTQVLVIDPKEDAAWRNNARAYLGKELWHSALLCCAEAHRINNKHPLGWRHKGFAHSGLGQWKEAVESFEKSIELDPEDSYTRRGYIFALNKECRRFATIYEKKLAKMSHSNSKV